MTDPRPTDTQATPATTEFAAAAAAPTASVPVLIRVGCALAGAVFLLAAAAKVVSPAAFLFEVQSLPLLDSRGATVAAAAFVLLAEVSLGVALVFGWRIRSSAACGAGLFAAFLAVLIFRAVRGEADSCTCFGELWVRPLPVALAMDAVLLAVAVACAIFVGSRQAEPARWKTWLVTAGSTAAMPAAVILFAFAVPLEPIAVGADLRRLNLPAELQQYDGDRLLIVLNTDCPWCRGQWPEIVRLHQAGVRGELPPASVGVFGGGDPFESALKIEKFRAEMNPPMELTPILSESTARRFAASRTPVTMLVRGGRVQAVWGRIVPTAEQIRAAG